MRVGAGLRFRSGRKPPLLRMDRKLVRFERLAERLTDLLEWFADLEEKQTGEYILDRQYLEARIDGSYDLARQILYDANVIGESAMQEPYEALDRLHGVSSRMIRELELEARSSPPCGSMDNQEWEWIALERIRGQLGATGSPGGEQAAVPGRQECLLEVVAEAHDRATFWIWEKLFLPEEPALFAISSPDAGSVRLLVSLTQGAERTVKEPDLAGTSPSAAKVLPVFWARQLLEGFIEDAEAGQSRPLRIEPGRVASRDPDRPSDIRLCLSESMILVRFPPSVPVRLLLCSLAPLDCDNLFYLFGAFCQTQGLEEIGGLTFFQTRPSSFNCLFRSRASWTFCARGLAPLQIGDHVRLLGRRLSKTIALSGQDLSPAEDTELHELLGGLALFMPAEREAENGSTVAGHGG